MPFAPFVASCGKFAQFTSIHERVLPHTKLLSPLPRFSLWRTQLRAMGAGASGVADALDDATVLKFIVDDLERAER